MQISPWNSLQASKSTKNFQVSLAKDRFCPNFNFLQILRRWFWKDANHLKVMNKRVEKLFLIYYLYLTCTYDINSSLSYLQVFTAEWIFWRRSRTYRWTSHHMTADKICTIQSRPATWGELPKIGRLETYLW